MEEFATYLGCPCGQCNGVTSGNDVGVAGTKVMFISALRWSHLSQNSVSWYF